MDTKADDGGSAWVDRVGALSGAAYVVLILVGDFIAVGGGEPAHATGAQVLAQLDEQAGSTAAHIGHSMEILGFVAFAFFLGWFTTLLRREATRASWLATTALVGGLATLAVKIGSVLPGAALNLNRDAVDETTARLLNDMGSAGFVGSFLPFGIFMLAAGLAVLDSGVAGHVTGWSAVVLGSLGIVGTVVTEVDPIGTTPLPFLLGLLWILVVAIRFALHVPAPPKEYVVATARTAHV